MVWKWPHGSVGTHWKHIEQHIKKKTILFVKFARLKRHSYIFTSFRIGHNRQNVQLVHGQFSLFCDKIVQKTKISFGKSIVETEESVLL